MVCDLNNYEFPDKEFDLIFCSGSIEYLNDTDWFFEKLSLAKKQVIMSYCTMERLPMLSIRRGNSWESNLTSFEIMGMMRNKGFDLRHTEAFNESTVIFDFRRG